MLIRTGSYSVLTGTVDYGTVDKFDYTNQPGIEFVVISLNSLCSFLAWALGLEFRF